MDAGLLLRASPTRAQRSRNSSEEQKNIYRFLHSLNRFRVFFASEDSHFVIEKYFEHLLRLVLALELLKPWSAAVREWLHIASRPTAAKPCCGGFSKGNLAVRLPTGATLQFL